MIIPIEDKQMFIDDEDFHLIEGRNLWLSTNNGRIYACYKFDDYTVRVHRLIMRAQNDQVVDHIDHNGLNNRKENLRFVTQGQNLQRSPSRKNAARYRGVKQAKGTAKFEAQINVQGRRVHLGTFATEELAARAYDAKARELFGEHAFQNFTT